MGGAKDQAGRVRDPADIRRAVSRRGRDYNPQVDMSGEPSVT